MNHRIRTIRRCLVSSALLVVACLIAPASFAQGPSERLLFVNGYVEAQVRTEDRKGGTRDIALPGARVRLVEYGQGDSAESIAVAQSDLSGRFILKTAKRGIFQLCVEAEGFERLCPERRVVLKKETVRAGTLTLPVPRHPRRGRASVYGNVTLGDGEHARAFQPFMGVNVRARVALEIEGETKYTAFVNNFGEYIVPSVPVDESFELVLTMDRDVVRRPIDRETALSANRDHRIDMTVANASPEIRLVSATVDGELVQEVSPGDMVKLVATATDPDGDKLLHRWMLPGGKLLGPDTDSFIEWKAPAARGRYPFTLLSSDERGGTERRTFSVVVGDDRIPFSGTVVDSRGTPLAGARVNVNGRMVASNAWGRFRLEVPAAERYVLTIGKDGVSTPDPSAYGTVSFVYTSAVQGGRWTLRAAEIFNVDPTRPVRLQQSEKTRDCIGPNEDIRWERYLNPRLFQWQDGRGRSVSIPEMAAESDSLSKGVLPLLREIDPALPRVFAGLLGKAGPRELDSLPNRERSKRCGPGIAVEIPPDSLVDARGDKPPGNVRIALSSIDVNATRMPGDWSAIDTRGAPVSMESYGAGSIEIGDGMRSYNLAPGASATVTIPIDPSQLLGNAVPDPQIPFLYYDEAKGIWEQDGFAELEGSGAGAVYRKKVTHFSTLNADILKDGQSCIAVEMDPGAGFSFPLDVEVILQPSVVNPDVIQVRTLTIDGTSLVGNVVYNLPNDSDIAMMPIIDGVRPDGSAGSVPGGVFIVNTGGPQTSASNLPPPNPDGSYYAEANGVPTGPCASRVVLTNLVAPEPAAGYEFLQGLTLQYSSNLSELDDVDAALVIAGAEDYYLHADPRDLRNSFDLFRQHNRFEDGSGNPIPPDTLSGEVEFEAEFANSGDLGFGRDMHCRRNLASDGEFDYACYVTNFGQPPDDFADQLDADNAHDNIGPDATVAMEYSRVENPPGDPALFPPPPAGNERAVKFFVYGGDPDAPPLTAADLDDFGERPVPQLCMMCHGGQSAATAVPGTQATVGAFDGRADIMSMGSSFLPFDLGLYNFPSANGKAAQQPAFKGLNEEIVHGVATANAAAGFSGAAIVELIDELYAGADPAVQDEEAVVAAWDAANPGSDTNRFYREVLGPTCRTCHIAEPYAAPAFASSTEFQSLIGTVQSRVCADKVMPHARRTHEVFWQSLGPNMPGYMQLYGQLFPGWTDVGDSQCGQFYQEGNQAASVFASDVMPVLVEHCASCHSTTGNANFAIGNAADTYASLLSNTSATGGAYIVPNDPGNSVLFQRLQAIGGSLMPQGGPDLGVSPPADPNDDVDQDDDGVLDLEEIENWIDLGAPAP